MLHIDQVSTLSLLTAGRFLHRSLRVCLIFVIALVLDGFRAAVRMAVVVEEATEGELVEGVFGVLAVAEPAVERVIEVVLAIAVADPQLFWVHGVKVGGVRGVSDRGDVRCNLLPQVTGEVNGLEERVSFDFVRTVLAEAVLGATAQLNDEIGRLLAELGRRGDVQCALPVDHLVGAERETTLHPVNGRRTAFHSRHLTYLQLGLQRCGC